MSDVTKLALEYPITTPEGTVISELTIRRAKAKDIRKMTGKTEVEQSMALLSALTGLVPEDLDEMDACDYNKLTKLIIDLVKEGKSEE